MIKLDGKRSWKTFYKNIREWSLRPNIDFIKRLWTDARHATKTVDPGDTRDSRVRKAIQAISESIKKEVLNGIKDGVDPALFPSDDENRMRDQLSLDRVADYARRELIAAYRRNLIRPDFTKNITRTQEKAQELICKVLLVASDAQTVTGTLPVDFPSGLSDWPIVADVCLRHCSYHHCNGSAEVSQSLPFARHLRYDKFYNVRSPFHVNSTFSDTT